MTVDLATIVQTALKTAYRVGVSGLATITRTDMAPDPLTGDAASETASVQTVRVVQYNARQRSPRPESVWNEARVVMFVDAQSLSFAPQTGDVVLFASRTGRITAVADYSPAGTPIAYDIAVGA